MYKFYYKIINFLFLFCLLSIINSCAYFKIKELDNIKTNKKDVFKLVSDEYKKFAKYELYEMHDEIDANYFAYKGLIALNENKIFPEDPQNWGLPNDKVDEVTENFNIIKSLINKNLHIEKPKEFSRVLIGYDCWVEQLEENWQIEDIEECKNKLMNNLQKIYQKTENQKINSTLSKKEILEEEIFNEKEIEPANNLKHFHFRVFFNFDSHILVDEEKEKLQDVIKKAMVNNSLTVHIEGHTDTKGSELYNLVLSNKRANFIKNYLTSNSVVNDIVIEGYGEKKPLLITKDNVKEKKNRRAEILLK